MDTHETCQAGLSVTRCCRMLKKAVSKAAASEEARRTLRDVEPLSDVRMMLTDFFSILAGLCLL